MDNLDNSAEQHYTTLKILKKYDLYLTFFYSFLVFILSIYLNDAKYVVYLIIYGIVLKISSYYRNMPYFYYSFMFISYISLLMSFPYLRDIILFEILYFPLYFLIYSYLKTSSIFRFFISLLFKLKLSYYGLIYAIIAISSLFIELYGSVLLYYIFFVYVTLTPLLFLYLYVILRLIIGDVIDSTNLNKKRLAIYSLVYSILLFIWTLMLL